MPRKKIGCDPYLGRLCSGLIYNSVVSNYPSLCCSYIYLKNISFEWNLLIASLVPYLFFRLHSIQKFSPYMNGICVRFNHFTITCERRKQAPLSFLHNITFILQGQWRRWFGRGAWFPHRGERREDGRTGGPRRSWQPVGKIGGCEGCKGWSWGIPLLDWGWGGWMGSDQNVTLHQCFS